MRSYSVKNGGGLASLVVKEHPIPTPGAHEVLLRVRANAFNYRDSLILRGVYPLPVKEPDVIPLCDGAGEIVAMGEGVSRAKTGDRVVVNSLVNWLDGPFTRWDVHGIQLSGARDGLLTEYIVLSEEAVLPMPEHLSFEEAATLPLAALTAWNALTSGHHVQSGETVLMLGSGGVSLFALQFSRSFGARTIVTTTSEDKVARLKALGADEVVNTRTHPNWQEVVRELTGGKGVNLVVENTNPGTLEQSIKATATSGQVSIVGWIPSPISTIDISSFFFNLVTLHPIYTGSRAQLSAMNDFITRHQLRPVIDRIFPFEEARAAYDYYEAGKSFGKVVIGQN